MPPVKKSQQQQSLMESMQPGKPSDWEMEGRKHERPESLLAPAQFCAAEQDVKALAGPLQAILEMDFEPSPAEPLGNVERSLRAPAELLPDARGYVPAAYEEFEYGGEIFALPAPYDEEPFQAPALFENCSPASSESSLDICFLRPVSFAMEAERPEHPLQPLPKSATSPAGSQDNNNYMGHISPSTADCIIGPNFSPLPLSLPFTMLLFTSSPKKSSLVPVLLTGFISVICFGPQNKAEMSQ